MSDHAPAASGSHDEAEHSHVSTYVTIFLVLGFLTIIEVFVPEVYSAEWNQTTKMLLLCILAVSKALLVGLYFMHLKWEKPWVKYIAMMPAYMGVFAILLMLEAWYRQVGV